MSGRKKKRVVGASQFYSLIFCQFILYALLYMHTSFISIFIYHAIYLLHCYSFLYAITYVLVRTSWFPVLGLCRTPVYFISLYEYCKTAHSNQDCSLKIRLYVSGPLKPRLHTQTKTAHSRLRSPLKPRLHTGAKTAHSRLPFYCNSYCYFNWS